MKMFSFFEKKYRHNYFNRKIRKALDIYFNKGNIKSLMEIFENNKNEDQLLALMNFFEACQDKYFRKFYTSSKAAFWHDYVQPFNFLYSIIKKISEKPDLFDSKLYDILKISSFDNQVFINQLALLFLGNIKNAKSLDIIIEIFLNRLLNQNINKHHFNNIINALSNINPKHCPSNVKNIIEHDFQTLIKNNNINKYNFTYIKYDNRALFSIFYDLIEYAIINRKNEILLIIFVSNFSDNEIEQFLIKLLHSERNEIRFLSAYLLYKYQNIEMVDELINLFRDDLIEIKTAAAYSLGSKKDKKIAENF